MADDAFPEDDLRAVVAELGGHAPPGTRLRPTASGQFNTTYVVEPQAGSASVLRIAPPPERERFLFYEHRMMRQEPAIHALARERAEAPAPAVIGHAEDHPRLGRDVILLERMDGAALSDRGLGRAAIERVLEETGAALARVHGVLGSAHGYAGPHAPMEPQADWPAAFAVMWGKLIDDIERCRGYDADTARWMRRLLDRHAAAFPRDVAPCLLHMDVWAQNILVDDAGGLTALLDWDRALFGDPEIEFAVLEFCGLDRPALWRGYGAERPRGGAAETRRLFYLLYELQKYIVIERARAGNPEAADAWAAEALRLARGLP